MLASVVASAVGLGHPVWAVVSALVVSQDTALDTRRSFVWRVAGTAIGLLVAVAAGSAIPAQVDGHPLQLAVAITSCAAIARRWPALRVCMWTAPIVLMTTTPGHSVFHTAIERGSEVVLGATIATMLHLVLSYALRAHVARRDDGDAHGQSRMTSR